MSGILAAQSGQSSGQPTQCADVVLDPPIANTPVTVSLSTTTVGAHIFYTKGSIATDPVHTGDNAGPGTVRIGSNSGSVDTGAGIKIIRALAYEPTHLDSNITEGDYEPAGGG